MHVESSNSSKRAVSFSVPEVTQVEGTPRKGSKSITAEKRVNVTITILSMAGLFVKDSGGKRKKKRQGGLSKKMSLSNSSVKNIATEEEESTATEGTSKETANGSVNDAPPTMMVASFSRVVCTKDGKERTVMTHVPSLPIQLPHNTDNCGTKSVNSPVHWPGQLQDYDDGGQKILSSYQFQSTVNTERIPEPFSIQISTSRYGRMINLGTAHIPLTGCNHSRV
jgi:hypothetical protein